MTEFAAYASKPDASAYLDVLPVLENSSPSAVFSGPVFTRYTGPAVHPHLSIHIGAMEKLVAYPKLVGDPYAVFLFYGRWYQLQSVETYVVDLKAKVYHRSSDIMNVNQAFLDQIGYNQKMLGFEYPNMTLERRWDMLQEAPEILTGLRDVAMTEPELHNQIFMQDPQALVVQTCIRHGFDVTWGRLFYTYIPVIEQDRSSNV